MKRLHFFTLTAILLLFAFSGSGHAWQGRMGGMEDPYGLVTDESDFLLHPSKIVGGEAIKYYGNYRFTYGDVTNWDYGLSGFNYSTSGDEYKHDTTLGAAFPLGLGRMGVFFSYNGMRGNYDGNENNFSEYDLSKDFDNFSLRLLYGLPVGSNLRFGSELQFAYRQEENQIWQTFGSSGYLNYILNTDFPDGNLLPFLTPYDSNYWEASTKVSLDGKIGAADLAITLRGGFIFSGDNKLVMALEAPIGTTLARGNQEGDIDGCHIGGDLWFRYKLADDLALPFLLSIDHRSKNRDIAGRGEGMWVVLTNWNTENKENDFRLTAGGGVDKQFDADARIAAGLYYNYLQGKNEIHFKPSSYEYFNSTEVPTYTEHQVMLRMAAEYELSPAATLRAGVTPFLGWVQKDFGFSYEFFDPWFTDKINLDGTHAGISASLGGTVKLKPVTLEPFINGGWQKLDLEGNGDRRGASGAIANLWTMDNKREEWHIGGGLSVIFN